MSREINHIQYKYVCDNGGETFISSASESRKPKGWIGFSFWYTLDEYKRNNLCFCSANCAELYYLNNKDYFHNLIGLIKKKER